MWHKACSEYSSYHWFGWDVFEYRNLCSANGKLFPKLLATRKKWTYLAKLEIDLHLSPVHFVLNTRILLELPVELTGTLKLWNHSYSKHLLPDSIFLWKHFRRIYWLLWFNSSQQVSATQPLAHSLHLQWSGGENEDGKSEKTHGSR